MEGGGELRMRLVEQAKDNIHFLGSFLFSFDEYQDGFGSRC